MRFLLAVIISCSLCLSAYAETLLLDDTISTTYWAANAGWEFPGATATEKIVEDEERGPCLEGNFIFHGESRYAGLHWTGKIKEADTLCFWVKTRQHEYVGIRIQDATSQELIGNAAVTPGVWSFVEFPLVPESFDGHWAGANDGQLHFPLKMVLVSVNRNQEETGLRISDLSVRVKSVPANDRWEFKILPGVPSGVALRGRNVEYTLQIQNRVQMQNKGEVEVSYQIIGEIQPNVLLKRTVELDSWGNCEIPIKLPGITAGYRQILAKLTDANGAEITTESGLAVVPRPRYYNKPAPNAFFGMQSIPDMEAAERLGCKVVREAPGWRWAESPEGFIQWDYYLDPLVNRCTEHNMDLMLTLQAIAPWWAARTGENPAAQGLPAPDKLGAWENFVRQVAQRYKGKLAAIEIQNEPDLTCWWQPGFTHEEGVQVYADLLRTGYNGAKAGDPDITIAGLDVSGGDFDGNLHFTRAVLDVASQYLELYTGHPYSGTRYFGRGQSSIWPQANRMGEKCEQALDLIESYGLPRRMWIGELGWGLALSEHALSQASMDFAACVAQSLIVARSVPGVEKYMWFTLQGCNEDNNEYGLLRGNPSYPLPAACAYSTCAWFLENTTPVSLDEISTGIWRAVFKSNSRNEAVAAWWSENEDVLVIPEGVTKRAKWFDSFMAPQSTDHGVRVDRMPVYCLLSLKTGETADILQTPIKVNAARPVRLEQLRLDTVDTVAMHLVNRTSESLQSEVEIGQNTVRQEIPIGDAGATLHSKLAMAVSPGQEVEIPVVVKSGNWSEAATLKTKYFSLSQIPANLKIDGNVQEWRDAPLVNLSERRDILPPDPNVGWQGANDLSTRAWIAADAKGIVFCAEVTDDIHEASQASSDDYWGSDSIQLALDVNNNSIAGYNEDDRELGLVLGADGAKLYSTLPRIAEALPVPVAIKRSGVTTTYEAQIPWSALGLTTPVAGKIISINFIVNDNDGQGRSYWIGMTPGIGENKNPGVFRKFALPQ